jgi:hypothetical protein
MRLVVAIGFCALCLPGFTGRAAQEVPAPEIGFRAEAGRLQISVAGQPLATYVYRDPELPRPYFAHLRAPGGIPVTRTYPPVPGQDPTDHATFHPGLWLAFGDISGADYWRLKAPVRHQAFTQEARGGRGRASFTVDNRYLDPKGEMVVCRETCKYTLRVRPSGYLLISDSTFQPDTREFVFGDQEEMGLGIRVATPLTVPRGGRMTDSDGNVNEQQVRGRQPAWCDYSGSIGGKQVGIILMPDPRNTHKSWFHARDYGLLVANPFAGQALGKGTPSRVAVKPGESLRLRFGVLLHAAPAGKPVNLNAAYKDYLRELEEG